ncbi:MAG: hypothetical protein OEM63_07185, partial [Gammaproteobacteria bacterium]|nr:hypothetical protein [Gammaproteobacteria bacterium]
MRKLVRIAALYLLLPLIVIPALALAWLRMDAARPLDTYFKERQGLIAGADETVTIDASGQLSALTTITSDSGLRVTFRVIREAKPDSPLPVLVVLGGHRTGSDAVDLFGDVGKRAVVAMDYPYEGAEKVRGFAQIMMTVPLARKAFIDTPPAVSLVLDFLDDATWVDHDEIVIVGASLGVPFAALIAARDQRIDGAMLVHGAADNELWLEAQVARRNDVRFLHRPLATVIHWLAYGPTFDTSANVALISPRPVIIVGATDDER